MTAIEIGPEVIEFSSPLTQQSTKYAAITNHSGGTIAFKVKTTAPRFYCVRPNASTVAAGETVQVEIILLGLQEEPDMDYKCRDKFLVIALPCPHELGSKSVADAWPELEREFKPKSVSKKIKVKYSIDPDAEKKHKNTQASKKVTKNEQKSAAEEIKASSKNIKEEVKPKIEKATGIKVGEGEKKNKSSSHLEGSLNSTALIIIAIIALVLGWLYY